LNIEQIEDKAKNLVSSYPDDLEDTLVAELVQFAAFMCAQKPVTVNESAECSVQAFVIVESLSDLSKRRDCVVHLSVHGGVSASGERSFSKLGIVEGELRSSMGQERLSMLALMSIDRA